MGRKLTLIRHLSKDELERMYREEKDVRIKERLLAIILLYEGKKLSELPGIIKRCRTSIEIWLKRWNEQGYWIKVLYQGSLEDQRRGLIDDAEWDKVVKEIEDKGMTIKDVVVYVKDSRGVNYSYKSVWHILRKRKKVKYRW
jgi:transposase